jgi:ribosome maturation factor RimP
VSTAPTPDSLTPVLQPAASGLGLDLEGVSVSTAGRRRLLRVVVDKDGGVTLDDVAEATRALSRQLDATDAMGEQAYTLEVTSPGLDRPLTAPRHWRRNVRRLVSVTDPDGRTITGRIVGCDDQQAQIEVDGAHQTIRYADIATARVQVEFNRKDG